MTYIEREIARLERALDSGGKRHEEIYAARQALAWAGDPETFRAPCLYLTGIPASSEGCPAAPHHSAS